MRSARGSGWCLVAFLSSAFTNTPIRRHRRRHGMLRFGRDSRATESAPGVFVNAAKVRKVPSGTTTYPDSRSPCRCHHLRAVASRPDEECELTRQECQRFPANPNSPPAHRAWILKSAGRRPARLSRGECRSRYCPWSLTPGGPDRSITLSMSLSKAVASCAARGSVSKQAAPSARSSAPCPSRCAAAHRRRTPASGLCSPRDHSSGSRSPIARSARSLPARAPPPQ